MDSKPADRIEAPCPGNALTKAQFERIFACLADLASRLRLMAVLVVDGTGGILAQKMGEGWKETRLDGLAALAAGSFAASNEMARMLGETGRFKMLLHEGQQRNLFVCSITPSHFLVVAFESGVALGMIRIFTKRTVEQLAPVLSEAGQPGGDLGKLFDGNFQSMLDEELDRSFVEKR